MFPYALTSLKSGPMLSISAISWLSKDVWKIYLPFIIHSSYVFVKDKTSWIICMMFIIVKIALGSLCILFLQYYSFSGQAASMKPLENSRFKFIKIYLLFQKIKETRFWSLKIERYIENQQWLSVNVKQRYL